MKERQISAERQPSPTAEPSQVATSETGHREVNHRLLPCVAERSRKSSSGWALLSLCLLRVTWFSGKPPDLSLEL